MEEVMRQRKERLEAWRRERAAKVEKTKKKRKKIPLFAEQRIE